MSGAQFFARPVLKRHPTYASRRFGRFDDDEGYGCVSRPPEADRAIERLKASATLDRMTPALTALRMAIRNTDTVLDEDGAEALVCELLDNLQIAENDPAAMAALADAAAADPAAAAMIAYAEAGRISANVAAVRTAAEQMANAAKGEQATALLDLIVAASRSPKVPIYVQNLLDELFAAGLTNDLNAAQRKAIAEIINDPNFGKGRKVAASVAAAVAQPIIAASWASLPDPVPGFAFVREKVHQNVLNRAVIDAGLPPAISIDFFVAGGSLELANIEDNRARANFTWQWMKAWLADTGASDPRLDMHRKRAWTFLLGHVHGFLVNVQTIDKVTFASPWASDEVIHMRRVLEEPAEG